MNNTIEEEAAKTIGLILFEFTRLDMSLGLCVVWTNEGKNLKELSSKYNQKGFSCRLKFIEKLAHKKYARGSDELNKYINWIKNANDVREIRNQLVHGRYGFIPHEDCVANVVGLPTSPEQSETRYTLKQLNSIVKRIKTLSNQLSELRREYPV
ncbi:hypothetical protein K6U44_15290 [Vibrio parahaemolyticus]|uniref:hypothetical protein n=1 Tax=Vibrio parahaemolyticus TaxID=670 RepID=UPI001EE9AF2F|nr:hypothetical protein [Vibrio parahaemolyticus]MCG6461784.1 hypothetical protein [Vibrio parahaemolyticus]